MTKQYKSEALAAAHEAAMDMVEAGVMSKQTMKGFDEMCLTPVEDMAPEENSRASTAREREPSGVCSLPQRHDGSGEPVGAR